MARPFLPLHATGMAVGRIEYGAVGTVACLTWWSFAHLSRQVVVGASANEMASQAFEGTALGVGWLLAVAAIAVVTCFRTSSSPTATLMREPAPFPRPPRTPGAAGRIRHGSVDKDCTSRQATTGCVPVGQYSSSSSRRAA